MAGRRRVLIIGLDCATPQFMLDEWADELPVAKRLMDNGVYGRLTSTIPPITCPAWMCMATSKDPGQLGLYGFRNRKDYTYDGLSIANSTAVREDTVWDILGRNDKQSAVIGVPMTFPPKPLKGWMVTSFLTPGMDSQLTYPAGLKQELLEVAPEYQIDVRDFRTDDKDKLLRQIYEMTEARFKFVEHMLKTKDWDFLQFVEMGIDRLYHGFWRYCARDHRLFQPGNQYEDEIFKYHKYVDDKMGELLEHVDDDTVVFVVSDHGAKNMVGGICINDWLIRQGLLTLKGKGFGERIKGLFGGKDDTADAPRALKTEDIDWTKTKARGEGGYYGRVLINVEGREPDGVVPQHQYEAFRDELAAAIEAIPDHEGNPIGTKVYKPENVYKSVRNIPPDLIVYFGDLDWRSAGTIGNESIHIFENDTGPDDANHAQEGMFILYDPKSEARGELEGIHLYDIAPTVLQRMGIDVPEDMIGKAIEG
ncbi:MAG TPA: alkaline phosphatase family protein [Armatimonadota bacterium]|nr:alkaline phosphatase family protein [Armatimonadota bacterium]